MLLYGLALALALRADPGPVDRTRAELDALAVRIESLKSRRLAGGEAGRELDRLLVRAQELAAQLERAEAPRAQAAAAPAADELRERADALHDDADRLAAVVAALDVRISDARRAASSGGGMTTGAAVASGRMGGEDAARIRALQDERARASARLTELRAAAAALEAEANAVER
jgi:hypothetical protein